MNRVDLASCRPRRLIGLDQSPAARAILGLAASACRWPLGVPDDDAFRFCGQPRTGRGSYCAAHATLSRAGIGA